MGKDTQWMAIGEAAKYLGVSRDTLRRWGKSGKIKVVRSPTNRRYYTKSQLDNLMAGKKAEEKVASKPGKRMKVGKFPKLILVAFISFIITAALAFLIQYFLIK